MNEILSKVIEIALDRGASDIHLTRNIRPVLRIHGVLTEIEGFPLNTKETLRMHVKDLLSETDLLRYEQEKALDSSFQVNDSRFRSHIYRQAKSDALALRVIPTIIPSYDSLFLPESVKKFTELKNGLVLVVGTTGSGKSTTLASIIDDINTNQNKHIITIENPVEFLHQHKKSVVNQREVGVDVISFSDAVKDAMREDPDILLVGELRDLDTISNAITMAETGHLVFGTLHTRSVAETIDRIIDVFPPGQQEQIRLQLSNSIGGIVSQQLLPKRNGGRIPCCEIMFSNEAIKNMIRSKASPNSITDQIFTDSMKSGSQTKEQSVASLYRSGYITRQVAEDTVGKKQIENLDGLLLAIDSKEKREMLKRRGLSRNSLDH